MNAEKTPLAQKLIIALLSLILVCLVVLIAQNRIKPAPPVSEVKTKPVPTELEIAQTEPKPEPPRSAAPNVVAPRPVRDQVTPLGEEAAPPAIPASAPPATPPPYVTLVSPAKPAPIDIVVHPDSSVLKTEICGRVRLEGRPPPEIPINFDESCSRLQEGPVTTRHYVVGPEGGLANVLVYIKAGLPTHYSPPPLNAPTVTVSRCVYEPYVVGMQAGQKLTVVNSDRILHNVHLTAKMNREVNFALSRAGQKRQLDLEQPEIFARLKCDVHPWEFGYVGVLSNPFFAVTDTNGVFCLPAGLPHGRYVLAAAHLKAGETLREIVVGDNIEPIDLAFSVPRR
jgi:hypothetical protein